MSDGVRMKMDYATLCKRCCRIMGFHPDSTETPLDCLRLLNQLPQGSRAIAAEMMARELAEYVEAQR